MRIVDQVHPVRPELAAASVIRHAPTPVPSSIRARFPALTDPAVVYLDSAATTQKPDTVIAAVADYRPADPKAAEELDALYRLAFAEG